MHPGRALRNVHSVALSGQKRKSEGLRAFAQSLSTDRLDF